MGDAIVWPVAPGTACPREGSMDTPAPPAFSLRQTCPQTPHLLSPSFCPLFFFFQALGGVFGGFFFAPHPKAVTASQECQVGEAASPAMESRTSLWRRCSPCAFLQQCRTALSSSQHSFSLTTVPSFILFPRWLAGLLPVTSLLSSSRSSCFYSVQDSLMGGIESVTPRWRLLFPSSIF